MDSRDLTPPYARYLVRLIRPFPNWDFFFIKPLRQRAVRALRLKAGNRVLDVGCGPGGTFPFLRDAVGPGGEVVGVEISPEATINARKRIEANGWKNVRVIEEDARTVKVNGLFDGLVLFAAPDVYASPQAIANLVPYLTDNARVVVFGAKLSNRRLSMGLNLLLRSLMKLSFATTPALSHEPLCVLRHEFADMQVEEHFFGAMFLAWGSKRSSVSP